MEPSAKLLSRMDEDIRKLVRNYRWFENVDKERAMGVDPKLLNRQLKAEQDRAKRNSPFYCVYRHAKLLAKMQLFIGE